MENKMVTTIDNLIREYYRHNPEGHYFDKETLKFFGECVSKMYLCKNTSEITDCMGNKHTCYCIRKVGKDFLGKKCISYAYFDVNTFEDIF